MSEAKKEYIEVKVDISSEFMDALGDAVKKALLKLPKDLSCEQDSFIWSLIFQAIEENTSGYHYAREAGSEFVKVVYDVHYTECGRAPEFIAHFRRPKTEGDREREEKERRQDIRQIAKLAEKHRLSVHMFDTPETYGRFGTVQHTVISGPPKQTGTYLLWIDPNETGTENPGSFYYDAEKNAWYDHAPNSTDSDAVMIPITCPAFTAYMGPIPTKVG